MRRFLKTTLSLKYAKDKRKKMINFFKKFLENARLFLIYKQIKLVATIY